MMPPGSGHGGVARVRCPGQHPDPGGGVAEHRVGSSAERGGSPGSSALPPARRRAFPGQCREVGRSVLTTSAGVSPWAAAAPSARAMPVEIEGTRPSTRATPRPQASSRATRRRSCPGMRIIGVASSVGSGASSRVSPAASHPWTGAWPASETDRPTPASGMRVIWRRTTERFGTPESGRRRERGVYSPARHGWDVVRPGGGGMTGAPRSA